MVTEKKLSDRVFDIFTYVFLVLLAFLCVAPFIHILAVSLSATAPSMGGFVKFWPIGFNLVNYEKILGAAAPTATAVPTIIPTATPTPTPLPTPTPKPKPTPTIKPTPTPKPQPKYTSEQIYGFTERFGGQYGVDPNVLRHVALCESGFRPEARNISFP